MKSEGGVREESQVTVPPGNGPCTRGADLALTRPPTLHEEVSTTIVTAPATEAVLASWARIASSDC